MGRVKGWLYVVLITICACSQKTFESEKELQAYIMEPDNGYMQQKSIYGYEFSLLYRPTDLLVKQELGSDHTQADIDSLRAKYNKYMYFNLSMSKNGQELLSTVPKDRNDFGAMVNQLAFGMEHKVHLFTQAKDTLELVDFVYPRMYGMSRATTLMFVYPRDKEKLNSETLNFTVEDLGLFTGEVRFKVNIGHINNEPRLSFKS